MTQISEGVQLAIKLLLLTGQRQGEVVNAEISEFDLKKCVWSIPGHKTKNGEPHEVPPSNLSLEIVEKLIELTGDSQYLLPSAKEDKPINVTAVTRTVARNYELAGIDHFTPHDLQRTVTTHTWSN